MDDVVRVVSEMPAPAREQAQQPGGCALNIGKRHDLDARAGDQLGVPLRAEHADAFIGLHLIRQQLVEMRGRAADECFGEVNDADIQPALW